MKEKKPRLFGTSGIRGRFGEKVTLELAADTGRALATHLGGDGEVVVGYDTRTSSQLLENALIAGIVECGCDVTRLGMVPTPLVGYAASRLGAAAGVMITASHNPAPYNGIKLWNPDGMAYRPSQESVIESIIHSRDFKRKAWDELGSITTVDMRDDYVRAVLETVEIKKPLKVVIDSGCGAASHLSPLIFRKAGCRVITLNSQPDGFFPGRDPEPVPENLSELMETVRSTGADLGIAHDGDADRTICIDERGEFVLGDKTFALVEKRMLQEKGGGIIVTTVATSSAIYDIASENNGEVITTAVGDLLVARKLKETDGLFGGEENGGLIFPDFVYGRDAALTAATILEIMAHEDRPLSELVSELPAYYSSKRKIECPDEIKGDVMDLVSKMLADEEGVRDIDTTDGVKIFSEAGWVIIRPSGTEPIFRCFAESETQEQADEMARWGISLVERAMEKLK